MEPDGVTPVPEWPMLRLALGLLGNGHLAAPLLRLVQSALLLTCALAPRAFLAEDPYAGQGDADHGGGQGSDTGGGGGGGGAARAIPRAARAGRGGARVCFAEGAAEAAEHARRKTLKTRRWTIGARLRRPLLLYAATFWAGSFSLLFTVSLHLGFAQVIKCRPPILWTRQTSLNPYEFLFSSARSQKSVFIFKPVRPRFKKSYQALINQT